MSRLSLVQLCLRFQRMIWIMSMLQECPIFQSMICTMGIISWSLMLPASVICQKPNRKNWKKKKSCLLIFWPCQGFFFFLMNALLRILLISPMLIYIIYINTIMPTKDNVFVHLIGGLKWVRREGDLENFHPDKTTHNLWINPRRRTLTLQNKFWWDWPS